MLYPADWVFSIGSLVLTTDKFELQALYQQLERYPKLADRLPKEVIEIGREFGNSEFVVDHTRRLVFYDVNAETQLLSELRSYEGTKFAAHYAQEQKLLENLKQKLSSQGWKLVPIQLDQNLLRQAGGFDMSFGVLPGKNNDLCVFLPSEVADTITTIYDLFPPVQREQLQELLQDVTVTIISVPAIEVKKGACNHAKIGMHSQLVYMPSGVDCPITMSQVVELCDTTTVRLLPTPMGFAHSGGSAKAYFGVFPLNSLQL